MPIYEFECPTCGEEKDVMRTMAESNNPENCSVCGTTMTRLISCPNISGTRDGFGIKKSFIHDNPDGTKKEIDNWRSWEKSGYRPALECIKKPRMKEMVKEGIAKRKHRERANPEVFNGF